MRTTTQHKVSIIAHRGASADAPENTLRAFQYAVEMGADGIELDVQLTHDDEIVVAHDEKIDRVSDGSGLIRDYTYEELCRFNFGALHKDGPPERIPRLRDVYELIKPTNLMINVEIKSGVETRTGQIEEKILRETADYGMGERVIYSSFDHYSMNRIKKLDSTAQVGLLYSEILFKPWRYAKSVGAEAVHPQYNILFIPGMIKKCQEHGLLVNTWTVDEAIVMRYMIKHGVNALITNQVENAISVRDKLLTGK